MNKALVITGLIRNKELFKTFINCLGKLPESNKIPLYYSTWEQEAEQHSELISAFRKIGGKIILQKEVDLKLVGHALHQMVSLDAALSVVAPETFLLKMRPDFCDISVINEFLKLKPVAPNNNTFCYPRQKYKFYILNYFPSQPFFVGDISFAGNREDMLNLTSYPFSAVFKYNQIMPEQMIWGGSLIQFLPILDALFRCNIGFIFSNSQLSQKYNKILFNSELYAHSLALYFLFLDSAFEVIYKTPRLENEDVKNLALETLFTNPSCNRISVHHLPNCQANRISQLGLSKLLKNGAFIDTKLSKTVQAAILNYSKGLSPFNICFNVLDQARELGLHAAAIGLSGSKVPMIHDLDLRISGNPPAWESMGKKDSYMIKLEAEINTMRRMIDELNQKLARQNT